MKNEEVVGTSPTYMGGGINLTKRQARLISYSIHDYSQTLIGQLMQTIEILGLEGTQEEAFKNSIKDVARRFVNDIASENGFLERSIDPDEPQCKSCGTNLLLGCTDCPNN